VIGIPSRKVHNILNKLILGKSYDDVNRLIDLPYLWLRGKHRKYFHDPKTTPFLIAMLKRDPKAGIATFLHIATDEWAKDKKRKKLLETITKLVR